MKKFFKYSSIIAAILILIVIVGLVFVKTQFPKVSPAKDINIESTEQQIIRGKYLANNVAACMDCHSKRDWNYVAGPIVAGTEGQGGEAFTHDFGFPGNFYSKNITPSGIGQWSDGEIYRAITSGVNKHGDPFFPVMPYLNYGKMDPEDVKSIIAYLRTLKPIENSIPESKADFPMNFIMRTIPKDPSPSAKPDTSETLLYGEYLFTISACGECHTPQEKGKPVEGKTLAGGFDFKLPGGGIVRSSNITPDMETGIGAMSKENFILKFKYYNNPASQKIPVQKGGFNTVMPWMMYAGMTDQDLGAIYTFLRSVEPIKNNVLKFSAANQ